MTRKERDSVLHSTEAVLWDGRNRLPGRLYLLEDHIEVEFDSFSHSHLHLIILKEEIERVEEFLLFGVSRNGLSIVCKDGREDQFIVDDSPNLKSRLVKWLKGLF